MQIGKEASSHRPEHCYNRKSRGSIVDAAIPGRCQYRVTTTTRSEVTQSIWINGCSAEQGYHRGRRRRYGQWRGTDDADTDKRKDGSDLAIPYADSTCAVSRSRIPSERDADFVNGKSRGRKIIVVVTEAEVESAIRQDNEEHRSGV